MIDTIYQVVMTILNKELRGNVTPAEYNLVAKLAQNKIYRDYFVELTKDQHKFNRGFGGKGLANIPLQTRQKIDMFSKTATLAYVSGRFTLPSDLYFIKDGGVLYNTNVITEGQSSRSSYKGSSKSSVSSTFPQYHREGDSLIITPATIIDNVTCKYLRTPLDPKWTYTVISNREFFDNTAVDYQDFELHPSEIDNLAIEILSMFGVNIRDLDVMTYAENIKKTEEDKNQ